MPLIFTPEYIIAVAVAIVVTLFAKRGGFYQRALWLLSIAVIIITLWILGIHPLGFAVSAGGWLMFLITVLIGRVIQKIVITIH